MKKTLLGLFLVLGMASFANSKIELKGAYDLGGKYHFEKSSVKGKANAMEAGAEYRYEVIPGVSSFLAAAAAIKKEFTLPNVSQTVICTRIEGKTAVPEKEKLESLAEHRASMAIFLSVQMIDKVVKTLSTSYPLTTPVAVVQKASWPDQKIVFGTLETIEEKVKEAGINKTAQILVGDFLGNEYEKSKLYDKYFTHEYREGIKE